MQKDKAAVLRSAFLLSAGSLALSQLKKQHGVSSMSAPPWVWCVHWSVKGWICEFLTLCICISEAAHVWMELLWVCEAAAGSMLLCLGQTCPFCVLGCGDSASGCVSFPPRCFSQRLGSLQQDLAAPIPSRVDHRGCCSKTSQTCHIMGWWYLVPSTHTLFKKCAICAFYLGTNQTF